MQVPEEICSPHSFDLIESVNNREATFKVGKAIIEYAENAFSEGHYPMLSITIDNEPAELFRESMDYNWSNVFGTTAVQWSSEKYVQVIMNNQTGQCTISSHGDHHIEIIGMKTTQYCSVPYMVIPEKTVVFEW